MRRIILLVTVAAMMAVMTVFAAGAALAQPGGGATCEFFFNPIAGNFVVVKVTPSGNERVYTTDRPPANCEFGGTIFI
jgi:hypothetical protein